MCVCVCVRARVFLNIIRGDMNASMGCSIGHDRSFGWCIRLRLVWFAATFNNIRVSWCFLICERLSKWPWEVSFGSHARHRCRFAFVLLYEFHTDAPIETCRIYSLKRKDSFENRLRATLLLPYSNEAQDVVTTGAIVVKKSLRSGSSASRLVNNPCRELSFIKWNWAISHRLLSLSRKKMIINPLSTWLCSPNR